MAFGKKERALSSGQCYVRSHYGDIIELDYKLFPHSQYFPDLALGDHFMFSNLKNCSVGTDLAPAMIIIAHTNSNFKNLDKSYYLESIKQL